MQPVCGPVRRDVAAVAPDRPYFRAAEGLPNVLALFDVASAQHHFASGIDDSIRNRGHLLIDSRADPPQNGEDPKNTTAKLIQSFFMEGPFPRSG